MHIGLKALLVMQAVGLFLSLALFAVTFASRDLVVSRLQGFAVAQVEAYAEQAVEGLPLAAQPEGSALDALRTRFLGQQQDLAEVRKRLVPALVAFVLSEDCAPKCDRAALATVLVDQGMLARIAQLKVGQQTVSEFIQGRYHETVQGLVRDLRRFAGVTALAFGLMIGLVLTRHWADWRFTVWSVGLFLLTLYVAHWYIFAQDWATAILFNAWAAQTYQVAMIAGCGFMADWLFLRGIITRFIGNMIASALSSIG